MKASEAHNNKADALSVRQIEQNIHQALVNNGYFDIVKIRVKVARQSVLLKGTVGSWDERKVIAHAAWSTPGVAMVKDQIMIKTN